MTIKSYETKLLAMAGSGKVKAKAKGTYTKEMRLANLAKARSMRGKGITSTANTAIETAIGRGITSEAETAIGTASGKGYYTQDYVPSDQLNFLGSPLDNMDYAKIRSRREDKRKKGEYTYSKEMADNEMPIPTVSGSGKKKGKKMLHKPKRTYEEELINDGYIPTMAMNMPRQMVQLYKGSGLSWNDFVSGVRDVEGFVKTGMEIFDKGSQLYDRINRATPPSRSNRPSSRTVHPNTEYNQTNGLYEPLDEWQHIEQPLSDRPNRRSTSIAEYDEITPSYSDTAYSDRPTNRRQTSNIPIERISPRATPQTPSQRQVRDMYAERDMLPEYRPNEKRGNYLWDDAERTLEDGRKAKRDIYYQPTEGLEDQEQTDRYIREFDEAMSGKKSKKPTRQAPKIPKTPKQMREEEEYRDIEEIQRQKVKKPYDMAETERQIAKQYRDYEMYDENRRGYEREAREMMADRNLRAPTKRELEEQKRFMSKQKYGAIEDLDREERIKARPPAKAPAKAKRLTKEQQLKLNQAYLDKRKAEDKDIQQKINLRDYNLKSKPTISEEAINTQYRAREGKRVKNKLTKLEKARMERELGKESDPRLAKRLAESKMRGETRDIKINEPHATRMAKRLAEAKAKRR